MKRIFAAIAILLSLTAMAAAGYSERTRRFCIDLNYAQREGLADKGDPDAIYCSAVWQAVIYGDETRSTADRQRARARALQQHQKARALGYDFNRIAMYGKTFAELMADGDALANGTRGGNDDSFGEYMGCTGRLGIQCMGQCAGNTLCQSQCVSNNAWQCSRR